MTSLESLTAFRPDTCSSGAGGIDWSAVGSAGAMSAFCGIMAGFVFAGIVVVIGERNPASGDGHASRGLRLLLPCFVGLATASYLYALTSGELVCNRAITEQLFSGAILAGDAVVVIVALAWLLPAYGRNTHGTVSFFRGLIQFAAQFSMLMVVVSASGFTNSVLHHRASGWSDALVWGSWVVVAAAVFYLWRKPLPSAPSSRPEEETPEQWRDDVVLDRRVRIASWTTLYVGGVLAIAGGVAVGIPYGHWTVMPPWLVYGLGEASLLLPGAIIVTAVWAVPRE
ncbi:hypothetical protein ACFQ9Z_37060 [Streptomyces sp. NPDC056580]|uniref:hypothetical protein n=1 Tax=Streptomyces sp. NPDC056580 TaxID=3345872 RepID=UPI0036A51C35